MMKDLQFVMTTSMSPWGSDTSIIEQTIGSAWKLLGEITPPTIYCDGIPLWATKDEAGKYKRYIHRLERIQMGHVIRSPKWVGLVGLYRMIIKDLQEPVVFNLQHDWIFIEPQRIDISGLIDCLKRDNIVQIVRPHKRSLPQSKRYVDREYYEVSFDEEVNGKIFGIPLIKTDGWGDSPHFATQSHYKTIVEPLMDDACGEDGRYGVEGPLWKAYHKDIAEFGFVKAHEKWGSFIYGRFGDEGYVRHLGGDSRRWRKSHGLRPKR